jgi:hypothetical protein
VQRRPELAGRAVQPGAQLPVVEVEQRREARPDRLVVGPDERVEALQVDVVGDGDEAPGAGLRAQRAGGVGEQQGLGSQPPERAHRRRHGRRVDALVDVRAPAQAGDRHAVEHTQRERAGVARDRAGAEAGQLGVGDRDRVGELVGQRAEARAEHEPEPRTEARRALEHGGRRLARAHRRLSGPKDSGSSSASEVVRRTRSRSAR